MIVESVPPASRLKRAYARELIQLLRPKQAVKNLVVLAGWMYSENRFRPEAVTATLLAVMSFILLSCAVYVFNDLHDRESDAQSPERRHRPLARGSVSVSSAIQLGFLFMVAAFLIGALLPLSFILTEIGYVVIQVGYTAVLRKVAWFDILALSLGFVLRYLGGVFAVQADVSAPIAVLVLLVSAGLLLSKRLYALDQGVPHMARMSLLGYGKHIGLAQVLYRLCLISGVLVYGLFATMSLPAFGWTTILLVLWMAIRYLRYAKPGKNTQGRTWRGHPEQIIWQDRTFPHIALLFFAVTLVSTSIGH